MKQAIIVAALAASAGAFLLLVRSSAAKRHKPRMTFADLYNDNLCELNELLG